MDRFIAKQYGTINGEGKMSIYSREIFYDHISRNPGVNIEVVVTERERAVGNSLRGYYFGIVVRELQKAIYYAGDEWSLERVDTEFRRLGLYKEILNEETGEYSREPLSLNSATTAVTRKQFKHYLSFCIRLAAEYLNWPIPFPHEIISESEKKAFQNECNEN